VQPDSRKSHAYTYLNYPEACEQYGKLGGFAHIKSVIDQLRGQAGEANTLLVEGGDLWQGSATALWTKGQDMVALSNRLGVDIMTGHWEFTYGEKQLRENIASFKGEFLAQNVFLTQVAAFNGAKAYDQASGRVFKPYTIKRVGGRAIAVIGQAFPYVPIAHPKRFTPDWTFGIHEDALQKLVDHIVAKDKPNAIVLLSHNGMDVDLKLASRVRGIDLILGGHTHDAVPAPTVIRNGGGKTLVTNAGTSGKFIGVADLKVGKSGVTDFKYNLLPVYEALTSPDREMAEQIRHIRAPYEDKLTRQVTVADQLLWRRGNFNGTMDQMICDAQNAVLGSEIAMSPGFRWGPAILEGQPVTFEDIMAETAITYPNTYTSEMTGSQLKNIMEDVCDNLFNKDPYYQQGGDMVRIAGLRYTCNPGAAKGRRISALELESGKPVEPHKKYKISGWAAVNSIPSGKPIWDVVAQYLEQRGNTKIERLNTPKLIGLKGNHGIADYRTT
jgi:sulfur-oxidizing protein SoxB